ncbi:MAG: hypothetical protein JKX79_04975 [Labilibaculum sp.]|nr:hypothetical protein [Labilibaculum sp.]
MGGSFASPVNSSEGVFDLVFTYDSRALANNIKEGAYYYKFKLKGDLPNNLTFEYSEAIPWFDLPGNADQIKSNISFDKLSNNVEIVETLKYIGGKWIKIE